MTYCGSWGLEGLRLKNITGLGRQELVMQNMVVYRFYWCDPINGNQLVGTLPERRKGIGRITQESLINWGKKYFGKTLGVDNIFIIPIEINTITGRISVKLNRES